MEGVAGHGEVPEDGSNLLWDCTRHAITHLGSRGTEFSNTLKLKNKNQRWAPGFQAKDAWMAGKCEIA
jgi:hypothetical protein